MSVRKQAAESMRRRALDVIDKRIAICRQEVERYEREGSSLLGSERAAMFEAQLLRDRIAELPTLQRRALTSSQEEDHGLD